MKHFPTFKTKFCPHAVAHTMAPESWRVLFSQRRRWINSTVHNLCELVILPELFGFCCFSMRFFVFIDLLGTIVSSISRLLLPANSLRFIDPSCHCGLCKVSRVESCASLILSLARLFGYKRGHSSNSIPSYRHHHAGGCVRFAGTSLPGRYHMT
jgi:hypothetical protein